VGRAGVEPATLCLKVTVSGTASESDEDKEGEVAARLYAMLPIGSGQCALGPARGLAVTGAQEHLSFTAIGVDYLVLSGLGNLASLAKIAHAPPASSS
jgi:hypothetical protein